MFALSERLKESLPGRFVGVEIHDDSNGDWEDPDRLWLEKTPEDETCDGQYIDIGRASENESLWVASHDSANRFGGHPTHWNIIGTEPDVEKAVIEYLQGR